MALSLLFHQEMTQIHDLPNTCLVWARSGEQTARVPALTDEARGRLCSCHGIDRLETRQAPSTWGESLSGCSPCLVRAWMPCSSAAPLFLALLGPLLPPLPAVSPSQKVMWHRLSCAVFLVLNSSNRSLPRCVIPTQWNGAKKRFPSFCLLVKCKDEY